MNRRFLWPLVLTAAMTLWSTSGVFARILKDEDPLTVACGRALFAVGALSAILWWQGALSRKRAGWWCDTFPPRMYRIPLSSRRWRRALCHWGLALSISFTNCTFIASTGMTSAATGIVLMQTAQILVVIGAPLLTGERPRLRDWLAALAVTTGVTVLAFDHLALRSFLGVTLGVLGGLSFGCTILLQRRIPSMRVRMQANLAAQFLTIPLAIPFLIWHPPQWGSWSYIFLNGTLGLAIPVALFTWSAPKVRSSFQAAVITSCEPVAGAALAYLLLGEIPGQWSFAGGAIILAAIFAHASLSRVRGR